MGQQISVTGSGVVQVNIETQPNIQVTTSRAAINTVTTVENANYAAFSGNVVNASQPNITAVGTLGNLIVSGNINAGNVKTNNYLYANGVPINFLNAAGSNGQLQFNLNGNLGATGNLNWDGNTETLYATNFAGNAFALDLINGANIVGNVPTVNAATFATHITGNSQPNITSVGNLIDLTVTGNLLAGLYSGNGAGLTNINAANIVGNIAANTANTANIANIAYSVAGSNVVGAVAFATTANSVAGANVSGIVANANYAAFAGTANTADSANSVSGSNVIGPVAFAATANSVAGANVSGIVADANYAAFSGNVVNASQPNITSVGTLTSLSVTGNVSANYFLGNGSLLTGVSTSNTANFALFAGTANTANVANSVSGSNVVGPVAFATTANSVSGANVVGEVAFAATANSVAGANVSGIVANANYAAFSGNVVNANQPNITAVGTLTSLNVSGNALITGNLIVDGNLTYVNSENFNVEDPIVELGGGANGTPLTLNDGKDRGAILHYYDTAPIDAFMGWDNSNAEFIMGSNVTNNSDVITVNTLGNLRVNTVIGNLSGVANSALTANTVTANSQPNITSVGNLSNLTVTGNVNANYFIGNGYTLTAINGANIIGNISGNISNAVYADFAGTANTANVANSVSGANVVGEVAFAATANSVSGSNVVGAVAFATTANSVSGANVVGEVAFAATANSVAGANVSGTVANAQYANFAGTANTANVANSVSGANVVGEVAFAATANSVAGANVSGQVGNALIAGTVYTNAQPNITSVGTLANLTVTGNISANYYIGNGSLLTGIATGTPNAIVNGNSNVTVDANSNVRVSVSGSANTVVFTSSNTVFNAGSGGNITGANLVQANFFSGNGSLLTALNASNIVGTVANANYAAFAGTANTANVANSVSGANVSGEVAFAATANSVAGANVSGQVGNALVAGTVYTNAQPNITSVGALANLTVTGNVSANFYTGNGSLLTGITATNANYANFAGNAFAVDGANVSGEVAFAATANAVAGANVSGQVGNALIAGTVYTNAQPNITSLGTLTALTVNGIANLSSNANVKITGGSNAQVLTTDGTGNLSWTTPTGGTGAPGGANTEIQFNDAGVLGGSAAFTFNKTSNVITASGNIAANFFTGNGSLLTGIATGTPNAIANGTSNVAIPSANGNILFSANAANSMTITSSNVIIGSGSGAVITGVSAITSNLYNAANGAVGAPSVTFTSDTNTGLYNVGADQLGITTGGTLRTTVSNTAVTTTVPVYAANGAAATPSYTFTTDTNTGIYATGTADQLAISTGGVARVTVANANVTFANDIVVTGISNLGSVANLRITGGSNTQVLTTFGNGVVTWANGGGAGNGQAIVNGNSNVVVAANSNVTVSITGTSNLVTFASSNVVFGVTGSSGNITGANWITANVFSGNLASANQANITGLGTVANLLTTGNLRLAANLSQEGISNPTAATDTTVAFKIPIVINGNTYYFALTANV